MRTLGEEGTHLPDKERLQEKPPLCTPWSWTSSLHHCDTIDFRCLSGPVCGILLWQLEQADLFIL
jgi:hypothetical protein